MPTTVPSENEVVLRVADAIGELIEFWGFKRNMGRMWTVLYLSDGPLSAGQLSKRLSLSTGAVSMLLSDLAQWGVVKKAWVPGERRDYYEPETHIWKMVSRVFRERELRKVTEVIDIFSRAIKALEAHRASASAADTSHLELPLERIRDLQSLARIGEKLLNSVLSGEPVDSTPLERFEPE